MIWWLIIFFKILNFIIIGSALTWAIVTYVLPAIIQGFAHAKNRLVTQQKQVVELEEHHRKLHQQWVVAHQQRENAQKKIDSWQNTVSEQQELMRKAYKSRAKRIYVANERKQELQYQRKLQKETLFNALQKVRESLNKKTRERTNKVYLDTMLKQLRGDQ